MLKVSIITISLNQKNFIKKTIESVLNQDYKNIEYIIVDAGSTDGSRKIISSYENKIHKIIFEHDKGAADGLNKGFSIATGDIFYYLNSDDTLMPNAITTVVNKFNNNSNVDLVYGNALIIDNEDKRIKYFYSDKFNLNRALYGEVIIAQQAIFFKKALFNNTSKFNINNHICWDHELNIELFMNCVENLKIKDFIGCFRVHNNSITNSVNIKTKVFDEQRKIFFKYKNRQFKKYDNLIKFFFKIYRKILNPLDTINRIIYGSITK